MDPGATDRAPRRAIAKSRWRQSAIGVRGWARTTTTEPPRRDLTLERRALEADRGLFGGPLGCADAIDLGGHESRHEPEQCRLGRALARPHAQLTDRRFRDPQLDCLDALAGAHQRALISGRSGCDRQHGTGTIDQHQARVERARCGAQDLWQSGACFNSISDRREGAEIGGARSH
jgi:hypothetical protein